MGVGVGVGVTREYEQSMRVPVVFSKWGKGCNITVAVLWLGKFGS